MYVNINLQILMYLFTTYLATIVINQLQIQTGGVVEVKPLFSSGSGTFLIQMDKWHLSCLA